MDCKCGRAASYEQECRDCYEDRLRRESRDAYDRDNDLCGGEDGTEAPLPDATPQELWRIEVRPLEDPDKMPLWRWVWHRLLARFRVSSWSVCTMSARQGHYDYHDYPDCECGEPHHNTHHNCNMHHTCKRCGKEFFI